MAPGEVDALLHPLEIAAGAEHRARAAQDHHAHGLIARDAVELGLEIENQVIVEGVAHFGTSKLDRENAFFELVLSVVAMSPSPYILKTPNPVAGTGAL